LYQITTQCRLRGSKSTEVINKQPISTCMHHKGKMASRQVTDRCQPDNVIKILVDVGGDNTHNILQPT